MTKLGDVCEYRSESVTVQEAASMPLYISTDSMQSNRGPVSSSAIPDTGKVKRFEAGDTLVSNIRPYFKKIWHAEVNGTCSNDILVFRPVGCTPSFLFWTLNSDEFFAYVTKTAKGTKMPRGDKRAIMEYAVQVPLEDEQRSLCQIMNSLQEKIALNNRTNDYLEELVSARFAAAFGSNRPTTKLENVLRISTRSAKPQDHPNEIWEHYSIPAFDESHRPVMEFASNIKSNKYIVGKSSILISKLNPSVKRFWLPACLTKHSVCSTEFIVYEPIAPNRKSFYAAAISSDTFQNYLLAHVTGSTGSRQRAQPKSTLDYPMPNPGKAEIEDFCLFADPIYAQIEENEHESASLTQLRDTLLPKLMSGEIDVIKTDLTQLNNHLATYWAIGVDTAAVFIGCGIIRAIANSANQLGLL